MAPYKKDFMLITYNKCDLFIKNGVVFKNTNHITTYYKFEYLIPFSIHGAPMIDYHGMYIDDLHKAVYDFKKDMTLFENLLQKFRNGFILPPWVNSSQKVSLSK